MFEIPGTPMALLKKKRYIQNEHVEIWIENGIIFEIFKPGAVLNLEAGKKVVEDRMKVSNGVMMPIYVDISHLVNADTKTRKYMASMDALQYLSAGAFIMSNILNRLAFNIFLKINQPLIPTKGFTSEEKALNWLEHYKNLN